jgi:hypothetical protein
VTARKCKSLHKIRSILKNIEDWCDCHFTLPFFLEFLADAFAPLKD